MVLINLKIFVVVDKGKWFILFISIRHCLKSFQIRSSFSFSFSCIRTEYGDLPRKSQYSVGIQENMDQKKLRIWTLFTQSELELCNTNNQQSNQSVNLTLFFSMFSLDLPENIGKKMFSDVFRGIKREIGKKGVRKKLQTVLTLVSSRDQFCDMQWIGFETVRSLFDFID